MRVPALEPRGDFDARPPVAFRLTNCARVLTHISTMLPLL